MSGVRIPYRPPQNAKPEALLPAFCLRGLQRLLAPRFASVGWDASPTDTSDTTLLRSTLIGELGALGDPGVIAEARKRFAAYAKDQSTLPANLIGPTLGIVGRYADQATYSQLLTLAQTTPDYRQKLCFYGALSGALGPKLAQQTLNLTLSPQLATLPQAIVQLVAGVAFSGEQPDLALSFFRQHQAAVLANQDALSRVFVVPALYGAFSDNAHADELAAYAKASLPADAAPQSRRQYRAFVPPPPSRLASCPTWTSGLPCMAMPLLSSARAAKEAPPP